MIHRETSLWAYREAERLGILRGRRLEVLSILAPYGPLTATQIAQRMACYKSASVGANVHARLCELREMGAVEEKGYVVCPVTQQTVILWDSTGKVAEKIVKKKKQKCPVCLGSGTIAENHS